MKPYKQFYVSFFGLSSCLVFLIALVNVLVDPYEIMYSPTISAFNKSKPEKSKHVRLFKAIDVTHYHPKTVLLGSSRVDVGLDPSHPALANNQPAYNLALLGTNIYEQMRYLQHAIANQENLKLVVLGIDDIYMFHYDAKSKTRKDFDERRLQKNSLTLREAININFSLDTFTSSVLTLVTNLQNPQETYYYPNGWHYVDEAEVKPTVNKHSFILPIVDLVNRKNVNVSEEALDNFKNIVEICRDRNIELIVFIQPTHATYMEMIRDAGLWPVYEQWKREIVKIVPVWDFSGYNSITTEPISNHMNNYFESSHYYKEVGDLIIDRMFNYQQDKVPKDFGTLITPENVESHLEKIRADRETWAKNNLPTVNLVENLKRHKINYEAGARN